MMKLNDWLRMTESALKMIESYSIIDLYKKKKKMFFSQDNWVIQSICEIFYLIFILYIIYIHYLSVSER